MVKAPPFRAGKLTPLIAQGYTTMAYFFLALFALPLLTIGLYRIVNPDWRREFWEQAEPVERS